MSEQELEHFQSLLDRVPEYKHELRQMLELRSLLHDDALTLTPPADLSEHVRIAVSSSFAADAVNEFVGESRRRRVILGPLRITAGALVAACLVVGVAFTPTLPPGGAQGRSARTTTVAATTGSTISRPAVNHPAGHGTLALAGHGSLTLNDRHGIGVDHMERRSLSVTDGTQPASAPADAVATDDWLLAHELPERAAAADDASGSITSTDDSQSSRRDAADRTNLLAHDPAQLLRRDLRVAEYNPLVDGATHRTDVAPAQAVPGEAIALAGDDNRRMTVGVAVGSGSVAETGSTSAIMQRTFYMSFNVSGDDRIGLELGDSRFQVAVREGDVFSNSGKSAPVDGSFFGVSGNVPAGGSSYSGMISETRNVSPFAKTMANDPSPVAPISTASTPVRSQPHNTSTVGEKGGRSTRSTASVGGNGGSGGGTSDLGVTDPVVSITERPVTFGALYYDRRVRLGSKWDVCGRVTLGGGSNSSVVTSVRAYATYATGFRNIKLTMGVGGSKLFNLTSSSTNGSTNLGVYYGFETTFGK